MKDICITVITVATRMLFFYESVILTNNMPFILWIASYYSWKSLN